MNNYKEKIVLCRNQKAVSEETIGFTVPERVQSTHFSNSEIVDGFKTNVSYFKYCLLGSLYCKHVIIIDYNKDCVTLGYSNERIIECLHCDVTLPPQTQPVPQCSGGCRAFKPY